MNIYQYLPPHSLSKGELTPEQFTTGLQEATANLKEARTHLLNSLVKCRETADEGVAQLSSDPATFAHGMREAFYIAIATVKEWFPDSLFESHQEKENGTE